MILQDKNNTRSQVSFDCGMNFGCSLLYHHGQLFFVTFCFCFFCECRSRTIFYTRQLITDDGRRDSNWTGKQDDKHLLLIFKSMTYPTTVNCYSPPQLDLNKREIYGRMSK